MLWAILGGLAMIAGVALALPLLRPKSPMLARSEYDAQVYRDQLQELERDIARSTVTAAEAETARTEISRRLLAADDAARAEGKIAADRRTPAALAGIIVALAVPAGALGLYTMVGSPSLPGQPALEARAKQAALARQAAKDLPAAEENAAALITRLGKILESRPDDLKGWTLYAGALSRTGRRAEAVTAWRRVVALAPDDAALRSEYAEARIFASGGTVTPAARQALTETLAIDAKEPRARYYAGLAEYQAGRTEDALRQWLALEAESTPEAPWSRLLASRIATLKVDRGINDERLAEMRADAQTNAQTSAQAAAAPRGPSAEDVKAAQQMSPEDRQSMIRGMVDGLAEKLKQTPDDLEGWLRLARSYGVLQDAAKARDAYGKAAALKPADVEILSLYAESIVKAADPGTDMPPQLAEVSERLLTLKPDHGAALWFTGIARAQAGDVEGARMRWTRLLALLDPGSPQHADVKARLESLPPPVVSPTAK